MIAFLPASRVWTNSIRLFFIFHYINLHVRRMEALMVPLHPVKHNISALQSPVPFWIILNSSSQRIINQKLISFFHFLTVFLSVIIFLYHISIIPDTPMCFWLSLLFTVCNLSDPGIVNEHLQNSSGLDRSTQREALRWFTFDIMTT